MLRIFVTAIVLIINFVVQSTLFPYIEIAGVTPNTALVIIIGYGILRGDVEGAITGFFAGLLQDIFFGRFIGLHAMLGMFVGFISGKPFKDFFPENYLLPFFLVAILSAAYEFLFYIIAFLLLGRLDILYYLQTIILPVVVFTTVLSIPVYWILYFINSKIEKHEKMRRKLF